MVVNVGDYSGKNLTIGFILLLGVFSMGRVFDEIWTGVHDASKKEVENLKEKHSFEKNLLKSIGDISTKTESTNAIVKSYESSFENINHRINKLSNDLVVTRENFKSDINHTNTEVAVMKEKYNILREEISSSRESMSGDISDMNAGVYSIKKELGSLKGELSMMQIQKEKILSKINKLEDIIRKGIE